ncbi:MAG: multicopper oxidase family protein [Pseudomonadota bacterium]
MKRREFLAATGSAVGFGLVGGMGFAAVGKAQTFDLKLQRCDFRLRKEMTPDLVSLAPNAPPPVLKARQGEQVVLNVKNALEEYTAMHWHGLRIPNDMDGVPYLTQYPIAQGETFRYSFIPPDAGTYWYHPHCMTMTQMARGLTGVLVIQEIEDPGFDTEQVINLRDFRLDDEDHLLPPYSLRRAARAGTLGNVMTANWLIEPVYNHQSGSLVRLRIVNTDTTRIQRVYLEGGMSKSIAWDGHPLRIPMPAPNKNTPLVMGPGQRVDLAIVMPKSEGQSITVFSRLASNDRVMATLVSEGTNLNRSLDELKPLAPNPVVVPDISSAEIHEFVFGWSPAGVAPKDGFCGSLGKTFWSINRVPWAGDAASGIGPLARLDLGKSYILRFRNESPNTHPIHLHGLAFIPLRSNKRKLLANWSDTMLLLKDEIVDVALVADNLGDWAFHCHIIEHQKTGLAGYIQVV